MSLSPQYQKFALNLCCAAIVGVGALAVAWTVAWPPESPQTGGQTSDPLAIQPPAPPLPAQISLDDFATVWTRRLQRPLVDLPPAEPPKTEIKIVEKIEPPAPPPVSAPSVSLRTIIYSQDRRLAVFQNADGKEVICGVGESIGDATVKSIDLNHVVLEKESTEFPFSVGAAKPN